MINIFIIVIIILIVCFVIGIVMSGRDDNKSKLTDDASILFEDEDKKEFNKLNKESNKVNNFDDKDIFLNIPTVEEDSIIEEVKEDIFDDEII